MCSYLGFARQVVHSKSELVPFLLSRDRFNGRNIASNVFGNFEKSLLRFNLCGKIDFRPHRCSLSDEIF